MSLLTEEQKKEHKREYYQKNKEKINAQGRTQYQKDKEKIKERFKLSYQIDPKKYIDRSNKYKNNINIKVKQLLGGKCVCCGENNFAFLTIDHIFNDGAKERQNIQTITLYLKILNNKVDRSRYRLMCYNCNCARRHGPCPHESELAEMLI